jgi:malonyl CoA-acyl carrier protein transacylase
VRATAAKLGVVPSQLPTAALFPGQGSALDGAGPLVRRQCEDLYELCRDLIGDDPFERAGESTRYAQPAIFLASIAAWRAMSSGLRASAFAGHSLGELSALTAAEVWSEADGLRLVVLRAGLMADASASGDGGMLALLKGDLEQANALAERFGVTLANDNGIGQTVLSGAPEALSAAASAARAEGLRAIALDVAGAFHSPAMRPAVEPFRRAVEGVELSEPSAPVLSGLTARSFEDVPVQLSEALCAPVRWRETVLALDQLGIERFLDVGPDVVLARMVKRSLPHREVSCAQELHVAA